jgi:hypothetical protein
MYKTSTEQRPRVRPGFYRKGTAASGGNGGLLSGVIGGVMASWFGVATVVIGIGATAHNAVFGGNEVRRGRDYRGSWQDRDNQVRQE